MISVLLTNATQRSTLAATRSLGRAGHTVHVCSSREPSLAGSSRYAHFRWPVPDPIAEPEAFAGAIAQLVRKEQIGIVLPMTDAAVTALLLREGVLPEVAAAMPTADAYRTMSDKAEAAELARGVGIRAPEEVRVTGRDDAAITSLPPSTFPIVVKPARSVVSSGGSMISTSVRYASNPAELCAALAALPDDAFPVLLQQRVEGSGFGIFLLVWEGRLLAAFAHRRIREKPPSGGVSVLRESIPLPPVLLEKSRALLSAVGWNGVAMVEFKGPTPEEAYLMEVNGRFWGSLQLALDAGVDFPRLLVSAASGEEVTPVLDYRYGVRTRWFWGDVDHLIARLRHSRIDLRLSANGPGRLTALWDFVRASAPAIRNEVLRWDDPKPAIRESIDWVRGR